MIKITFTHSIIPNGPATDISIVEEVSKDIYDTMHARLKQFVEQNVIANFAVILKENNQIIVSHFATTPENAQIFIDAYVDPVSWWRTYGVEFEMSQQEIDINTVDTSTTISIFDENDWLYGLSH